MRKTKRKARKEKRKRTRWTYLKHRGRTPKRAALILPHLHEDCPANVLQDRETSAVVVSRLDTANEETSPSGQRQSSRGGIRAYRTAMKKNGPAWPVLEIEVAISSIVRTGWLVASGSG